MAKQEFIFWNDTHKLTLLLEPLPVDPPIDPPEPTEIAIPTGIKVQLVVDEVEIELPTDIKLEEILENLEIKIPTEINIKEV